MGKRREARELALMCLHQWDLRGPDEGRDLAEQLVMDRTEDREVRGFARELLACFWEHRMEIDERIQRVAENWTLDRLAVVDRNVLRLAVAELQYVEEVPDRVTLDEAIEIAKKYSTEKSGAFVNGILDRIRSEQES